MMLTLTHLQLYELLISKTVFFKSILNEKRGIKMSGWHEIRQVSQPHQF